MFTALVITCYAVIAIFVAWLIGMNYGHVEKFWHALKNILTFASLRKPKKPVDRMVMFNGRMVAYGHVGILVKTAAQEHVLGLMPHNDEDVERACTHGDCRKDRLSSPPVNAAAQRTQALALAVKNSSMTMNEARAAFYRKDNMGRYLGWSSDIDHVSILADGMEIRRIPNVPPFQPDHDLIEE